MALGRSAGLLDEAAPDVRLINLETTITADGEFADAKQFVTACTRITCQP